MMFSREFAAYGGFGSLWRPQTRVLERVVAVYCHSGDLRWTIVALGLDACAGLDALIQKLLAAWAQEIITRALKGARFAAAADTTVAAGGSQGHRLFRAIGSLA